jgi:hypothetical protein
MPDAGFGGTRAKRTVRYLRVVDAGMLVLVTLVGVGLV